MKTNTGALAQKIRRALSGTLMGRLLFLMAFGFGVSAATLLAASKFQLLPEIQANEASAQAEEDAEWAETITEDESSDDVEAEAGVAETEEEPKVETPDSLVAESSTGAFAYSILSKLGIADEVQPVPPVAAVQEAPKFDRDLVLADYDNRISDQFTIPENLKERVGFWFDVYTKYDENNRVIHHGRFPNVIFKVVNVDYIINSDTPRRLWMRREKADKLVKSEAQAVRAALRSLSRKRNLNNLNETEKMVADALAPLGGNVHKQAARALAEVRVQTGQKNFFASGLTVSPRYLHTMEEIFARHGLPTELTRIPFVESSFNKQATSKVGASGIWQFMGGTGRKFMHVDDVIDERRSPLKASEAAARLLKENHMILYRSWPMAITAWNHGPGGIRKASQKAGSRDLGTIISRYRSKSFDFASSNFYCEFLAALHAEKYNQEIYGDLQREEKLNLMLVQLSRAVRVKDLIRATKLTLEDFLSINPELKMAAQRNLLLPKGFRVHVPQNLLPEIQTFFATAEPAAKRKSS